VFNDRILPLTSAAAAEASRSRAGAVNKSFEASATPEPLGALGALPDGGTTLPPPPRSCPKADRDVPAKYQNPAA
jgi:hypothetical protein